MEVAKEMRRSGTRRRDALPESVVLAVEESYGRIAPRFHSVATSFFDEFFRARPLASNLVPRDEAFAASFAGFIASNLRSAAQLEALLERMGARGLLTGLTREDTDAVGRSMIRALRSADARLTSDEAHAWAMTFAWALSSLRRGARSAQYNRAAR